jgi:hypothetical protein
LTANAFSDILFARRKSSKRGKINKNLSFMSEKVTVYELAYVLKVGESDAALKAVLAKNGATVIKEQPLSQIQLAYPIEKQGIALFGYQHLTLPSIIHTH